jgi:hypothetical protein
VQTFLLFISADAAQEKEKKRRKYCCLLVFQSLQPIQYFTNLILEDFLLPPL